MSPTDFELAEMNLNLVKSFFAVDLRGFAGGILNELSERLALELGLMRTLTRLLSVGLGLGFLASD